MTIKVEILTSELLAEVHHRSVGVLEKTGVRIESDRARELLKNKGAGVRAGDTLVKLPPKLIEESLAQTGRGFSLGGRRAGWSFTPGQGESILCMSGEAVYFNQQPGVPPREGVSDDWLKVTRLGEALDEIGIYWRSITPGDRGDSLADYIDYLTLVISNFSKHIQDPFQHREQGPWLLEVLSAVYGGRDRVIKEKPFSTLFCPQSPLVFKAHEIEATATLAGWGIPIAVMPMALMGATAPASLLGTLVLTNAEILASICIFQAIDPGVPIIYAPVLTLMEPRTGAYFAGGVEQSLMNGAAAQMGRMYNLATMITGLETDGYEPGYQVAEDKALTSCLSFASGADIFIGPGIIGSDMVLDLAQLMLDVEVFRKMKVLRRGISTGPGDWLDQAIDEAGPGGNFLAQASTAKNIRKQWYLPRFGRHDSLESWFAAGSKDCREQALEAANKILATAQPNPLPDDLTKELAAIRKKAAEVPGSFPFV